MLADPLFDRLARALAGRYTLVRELGRGGMATVYLGTDVKLGRGVAIKLLAPATRAYLGSDRFQREVLLAAQLSHPHIVPLFEVGDALQYAHENGVIHRDIKPENILLSRGHALVTDFGIAKLMEERGSAEGPALTGAGIAVGTAAYMSPEQASGDKRIDPRSDVYSLAAVLYEMLAGEPPFTGPSAQAITARVINDLPRPIRTVRPALPVHLERALAAGLAKSPADRPRTARTFVDALASPARKRRMSARQVAWMATASGVAIIGWIVWRGWRIHPPPGMVLVPAGLYPVGGGGEGAPSRDSTAVQLDAYFIDSAEVGVAAYRRYLDATRARPPWTQPPPDQWPATGVLWSEAVAYCAWRQPGGRLPTEDEWEAAARGPHGFRYPWGNGWERGRANADSLRDGFAPTGAGPPGRSWVGAVDLIGNAWEWTAAVAADARGQPGHVIKGGAFDTPSANATAAYRAVLPDRRAWLAHTGFRCARGLAVVPERAVPPASVAVLYFDTADTASAYLADGLTEAIITSLGRIERLSVKSRNAVRRFRGAADDPATLGRALDVAYLVSGSVGRPVRQPRYGTPNDSASRGARRGDGHHGRAPARRANRPREPTATRSRRLRSLPARELRARTADAASRASRDRPVRERPAARSGLHARPRPGRRRLWAVPRLGVGVPRPVVGGRVVSRVRRGGPRAPAGLRIRRRVDGARLPAQLPESAHVRGRARGAAARHRARSAERGGAPPIRDGSALVGSRLRRRRPVPPSAPARTGAADHVVQSGACRRAAGALRGGSSLGGQRPSHRPRSRLRLRTPGPRGVPARQTRRGACRR